MRYSERKISYPRKWRIIPASSQTLTLWFKSWCVGRQLPTAASTSNCILCSNYFLFSLCRRCILYTITSVIRDKQFGIINVTSWSHEESDNAANKVSLLLGQELWCSGENSGLPLLWSRFISQAWFDMLVPILAQGCFLWVLSLSSFHKNQQSNIKFKPEKQWTSKATLLNVYSWIPFILFFL